MSSLYKDGVVVSQSRYHAVRGIQREREKVTYVQGPLQRVRVRLGKREPDRRRFCFLKVGRGRRAMELAAGWSGWIGIERAIGGIEPGGGCVGVRVRPVLSDKHLDKGKDITIGR